MRLSSLALSAVVVLALLCCAAPASAACPASVAGSVSGTTLTVVASTDGQCGDTGINVFLDGNLLMPIGGKECTGQTVVNSNTFAGNITRKCNLMRPNVPSRSTPGWSSPQPAPLP